MCNQTKNSGIPSMGVKRVNHSLWAAGMFIVVVVSSTTFVQCQDYNRISPRNRRQSQYGGAADITFPDDVPARYLRLFSEQRSSVREASNEMPMELILQLNAISNFTELIANFVDNSTMPEADVIASRFSVNDDVIEKSVGITPKPALCIPEMSVVSLIPEGANEPSITYWPSCTRLNRCGGCCNTHHLVCTPTESVTKIFEVSKLEYIANKQKAIFKGKVPVPIEEHTKCKCDCRVKAEHCTQLQKYEQSQCRCNCVNLDDKKKCYAENNTKIWDTELCSCRCRDSAECTTGTYFDNSQCKCIEMPNDNTAARSGDRRSYILKPIFVGQTEDQKYLSNKKK